MNRTRFRGASILVAACSLAAFAAACGSSGDSPPAGAKTLSFEITDAGCDPHEASAPAGPITFDATGASASVTEIEVLDGDTILGEKENLSEGLTGSFSLTLDAGEYTLRCNGGSGEDGTLTVTGKAKAKARTSPGAEAAVSRYREYLEKNTAELVARTKPFAAAVVAGEVEKAKSLYAVARIPYERIEPVAESFGDLDPRIDARANDVPPTRFGGFHRIEKALWEEGTADGMAPVAKQLLADVEELRAKVRTVNLQAAQIANGANELLGEVSASKITGEEERYSHTDLVDFEANVEGAEAAFDAVKPLLDDQAPTREIETAFARVQASLAPYRRGEGFVSYTQLTTRDTRKLAIGIDALAEKLSEVPAQIVSG